MGVSWKPCVLVICALSAVDAQFGDLFILMPRSTRNTDYQNQDSKDNCGPYSACVAISTCPLIEDLLDQSCFSSDRYFHRLNALTCGHAGGEAHVCCPLGGREPLGAGAGGGGGGGAARAHCGEPMIRGAEYEGVGAYPWVARIGFTNTDTGGVRFACSGSIISERVVLTAAHCALAKPEGYKLSTVVVGEWDTERSPDCNEMLCAAPAQALQVSRVVVHTGYDQQIFRHDIALVVLKEAIKYSLTAAPICLNDSPNDLVGQRATLVGWGKLSGQVIPVSRQQKLDVPLAPLSDCADIFGATVPVHEGQLCAGGEEGRDACSGFGGAPLLLQIGGRYTQVGIVSFGSENCGSAGVPSVYTNIAHYYRWIEENSPSM